MEAASIVLEGTPNFRDLGGYASTDGRIVRTGRVFRSGYLAKSTDDDLATLTRLGIRTVVDFRSKLGLETFGSDRLPDGVEYVWIPIGSVDADPAIRHAFETGRFSELPNLAAVNRVLIRENAAEFGQLMLLMADSPNLPLIFHCIGGKDRTGIAAALLLSILGVPWSLVRSDYLASNAHFGASIETRLSRLNEEAGGKLDPSDLEAARRFFIVEGEDIDAVRDEILAVAGSIEAFVAKNMGVPTDAMESIRDELLEDPEIPET
ncbi:MAG: tyrosine-protein phosphatase [Acidimicrobiia bacterium]